MEEMEKWSTRELGKGSPQWPPQPPNLLPLLPFAKPPCTFYPLSPKGASDRGCRSPKQNRATRSREEPVLPSTTLEIGQPAPAAKDIPSFCPERRAEW